MPHCSSRRLVPPPPCDMPFVFEKCGKLRVEAPAAKKRKMDNDGNNSKCSAASHVDPVVAALVGGSPSKVAKGSRDAPSGFVAVTPTKAPGGNKATDRIPACCTQQQKNKKQTNPKKCVSRCPKEPCPGKCRDAEASGCSKGKKKKKQVSAHEAAATNKKSSVIGAVPGEMALLRRGSQDGTFVAASVCVLDGRCPSHKKAAGGQKNKKNDAVVVPDGRTQKKRRPSECCAKPKRVDKTTPSRDDILGVRNHAAKVSDVQAPKPTKAPKKPKPNLIKSSKAGQQQVPDGKKGKRKAAKKPGGAASKGPKGPPRDKDSGKKKKKCFGFWHGPRLRRMASLNAQAKVHILYERDVKSPAVGWCIDDGSGCAAQDRQASGRDDRDSTSSSSDGDCCTDKQWTAHSPPPPPSKSAARAKVAGKKAAGKRKRPAVELSDAVVPEVAPKRMASLNAQAILAAAYSADSSRKEKQAKILASIESAVMASIACVDAHGFGPSPPPPPPVSPLASSVAQEEEEEEDTVMDIINAVASEGLGGDGVTLSMVRIAGDALATVVKKTRVSKHGTFERTHATACRLESDVAAAVRADPLSNDRRVPCKTNNRPAAVVVGGAAAAAVSVKRVPRAPDVARPAQEQQQQRTKVRSGGAEVPAPTATVLEDAVKAVPVKRDIDAETKALSMAGLYLDDPLEEKVEVKTEEVRRDKIEDTAEVTITGMYINPVTNTSQSFCISRIHTYKQATSTRSYSPASPLVAPIGGGVGQPLSSSHHVVGTRPGSAANLIHGGHVSSPVHLHGGGGGGMYPYPPTAAVQTCGMGGVPLVDVGGLSRRYGSAFAVPHYSHPNTLPYAHGYYQPAGPMLQSLSDPCLIHKPVPYHPHAFPGQDRRQQLPVAPQQTHQPFPVDQCHSRQAPPYPPTGPGPGGSGGGGVTAVGPASAAASSSSPPSSSSAAAPLPAPPALAASAGAGAAPASCAGGPVDKCKPAGGVVVGAAPPPAPELYFGDGCQSCVAAAAAAAAGSQPAAVQHYARPPPGGAAAPPPPPPPPSSPAAVNQFLHAREHLQATVNPVLSDLYGRLPPARPAVGRQSAALPTQTKTGGVKAEAGGGGDSTANESDSEGDDDDDDVFVAAPAPPPPQQSNPPIAAAAKTLRNGRLPHRNKSSPPSADVAHGGGQRTLHHHLRSKEARLTVSLEDVFHKSGGTDRWSPPSSSVMQHRRVHVMRVEAEHRITNHKVTNNGLLTRSKALELSRNKCITRSCNDVLQRRAKLSIRDVTNERRCRSSPVTLMTLYDERPRSNRLSPPTARHHHHLLHLHHHHHLHHQPPMVRSPTFRGGAGPYHAPPSVTTCTTSSSSSHYYHVSRSTTTTSKGPAPPSRRNSLSAASRAVVPSSVPRPVLRSKGGVRKVPRFSNGWTWEGPSFKKPVYLHNDDPPIVRWCYNAMRHVQGDIIRVRDCILLKSGPRKMDLPFVAKVAALWENSDDGEMMVSVLWYYRPEHTEQGRKPHHMEDEIFASKHRDVNSVACIEDKCHVLTFNEYCRYQCRIRMLEDGLRPNASVVADLEEGYPRKERQPSGRLSSDLVFFCRKVYDFRQKRILKNPM